jgi:adenosylcobinamide-GDP ribazoletransferase
LPYARASGTGGALGATGRVRALVAAAIAVGFCVWLDAPLALAVAAALTVAAAVGARRWLGGVTGDVLGAAAELSEVAVLVTAVAVT